MNKIFTFILLVLFILSCKTEEKNTPKNIVDNSIKNNALELLEDDRIHSVSIGVYKDGEKYSGHFGELEIGKSNPPTDSTIYDLASVTKLMVGTVLANAILENKISLDDDIRKYLEGDYPNLEFNNKPIKIRDVITHTGGIPSNFPEIVQHYETDEKNDSTFFKVMKIKKRISKEYFFEIIHSIQLTEEPGTTFDYSNIGPHLIAHILEEVYHEPFEELMKKYVFDKYGMRNAELLLNKINLEYFPQGYNENEILMPHFPDCLWNAAGGVKATMPDILNFLAYQVEEKDPIVSETHQIILQNEEVGIRGYFFLMEKEDDVMAYMHNGYSSGTQNWFIAYPKYNLGISVVTNTSFPNLNIWKTASGILDDLKPFGTKSINRAIKSICEEDVEKGISYYHELKKSSPEKYNFSDEYELNLLGYQLMEKDKLNAAIEVFKLLVSEFPDNSNPYDSLGEAYYNNKQYQLSLINYSKSLSLDTENSNAEKMIQEIENIINGN